MAQKATHSRKKGGIGKILLALVLLLILAVGGAFLLARQEIDGRTGGKTVTVTIQQGSGVATIAKELKKAGVIRFPQLFRWYVGKQGAAAKLQYGAFELTVGESYPDLIGALSAYAKAESVRLTFPEGTTALAMAQKMEEYKFWQDVPEDKDAPDRFLKCEGYLFPDTYEFRKDDTVHNYVAMFYAHFDKQITDAMYQKMDEQRMTLPELITLASFV